MHECLHSSDCFAALHAYACSGVPTFFLACAVNVTRFHAMCQANLLSVSSPCCSSIKQSYILKSNLSPRTSLMLSPPWLDWIVVYCFRNATSARSIRLWHIKQQSLYYKEHAVIVSGVLGARWEPGIFFFLFRQRGSHGAVWIKFLVTMTQSFRPGVYVLYSFCVLSLVCLLSVSLTLFFFFIPTET